MSLITFSVPSVVCGALRFLVDSSVRRDPSPTRRSKQKTERSRVMFTTLRKLNSQKFKTFVEEENFAE